MAKKTRTKWDEKREASRTALLGAAMRSFQERGYAATTIADIVAGTGHTSGAFYFHFKDKAECFWAVVEHREDLRGAWWDDVLEGLDSERDHLEDVLQRAFDLFAASLNGGGDWVLVMMDFHQQHRGDAAVEKRLATIYEGWRTELRQFVGALAEGNWIGSDRDPASVASQIFAFREGLTVHARLYGLDRDALREAMIDGLVRLLR